MIQLHNVSVTYQQNIRALSDVSLMIPRGDFVFLTGASGAGKSTLLKLLYAQLAPSHGQVIVDNQNISRLTRSELPYLRRTVGIVFQDFRLLPNRTVMENVAITLEVLGIGRKEIIDRVTRILQQVGLEQRMLATPCQLSGGEQQRVALARALVNEPKILLADEPTGNLDDENKALILDILAKANCRGTTIIVASHDLRLVAFSRRRAVLLDRGELREVYDESR
jgi:cell division transport system ATP-binding protein